MDEVERILPGRQAASQAVRQLAEWRRAHPKVTLTEIEDAVFDALQRLQARRPWAKWFTRVPHQRWLLNQRMSDHAARRAAANWSRAAGSVGRCDRLPNALR